MPLRNCLTRTSVERFPSGHGDGTLVLTGQTGVANWLKQLSHFKPLGLSIITSWIQRSFMHPFPFKFMLLLSQTMPHCLISGRNLKRIARDLGEKLTDEELRGMIDVAWQTARMANPVNGKEKKHWSGTFGLCQCHVCPPKTAFSFLSFPWFREGQHRCVQIWH